ncbi:MAG: acyltransferase family protein [Pseudomonadota bacterium]
MVLRIDIQALRGLAVLLVVLHHAELGLTAGYLGVDIFFVISGYLITGMIKKLIEKGQFSFSEFYFRRAKRLLPAAYMTFICTIFLSFIFLTKTEFQDFTKQILGAITFTSNIMLWLQTGYFDSASTLKPLLHIWSLSIEEQYYLFLPAILFFLPKKFWFKIVCLILASSLLLCIWLAPLKPSVTFYLLPTRVWELAIGTVAALVELDRIKKIQQLLKILFWPAIISLLIIPIAPIGVYHPGLDAFIVCMSTIILILRHCKSIDTKFVIASLAKVGNFSYSLYLVHWPIFAFINNIYVGKSPKSVNILAVLVAFCFGFLLYRYIELPVRRAEIRISKRIVGLTILISFILVAAPFAIIFFQKNKIDYAYIRRSNVGFGKACEFTENFTPKKECRNSAHPKILVWGDSFAMHLVPGIAATTNFGVMQATRSACGPIIDVALIDHASHTRSWAEQCLEFNKSVVNYLANTPSIKVVVMSSPFHYFLTASDSQGSYRSLENIEGKLVEQEPSVLKAMILMRKTIKQLKALDKAVVIVAPPPQSSFDIGRCLERKAANRLFLGAMKDCSIRVDDYHTKQSVVLSFLKRVENELSVPVVYFDSILCSKIFCATLFNGKFIYADSEHLSYDGSKVLAEKLEFGNLLNKFLYGPRN